MKNLLPSLLATGALLLAGCATKDFKVVDALRVGMTKSEAQATMATFSVQNHDTLERPLAGWPESDGTRNNLPGRARAVETETKTTIGSAEYYPVGDGVLGFSELFLFYDESGRLVRFYRHQVN